MVAPGKKSRDAAAVPTVVFKAAFLANAAGLVLAHVHGVYVKIIFGRAVAPKEDRNS